jgi:hypothetical protein
MNLIPINESTKSLTWKDQIKEFLIPKLFAFQFVAKKNNTNRRQSISNNKRFQWGIESDREKKE